MRVIGVDTGGTFTDFIFLDPGRTGGPGGGLTVFKRLSTPHDPAEAVLDGVSRAPGQGPPRVVHGSTVATNAILERKGAPTALVANRGFTDVIEIGRQNRAALYDLSWRRPAHIVPRGLRFGAPGRVGSGGEIVEPLDEASARDIARAVGESGATSCAVCLLFSFLDPEHERVLARALAAEGLAVSASHEILAEFREFERTSTTVVNAYVSPIMARYLTRLADAVENGAGGTLSVMQSNGGSISAATAMAQSVRTILSGPAGGAVGAFEAARAAGYERVVTFDMGGTSTDVALLDGALPLTTDCVTSGYPVRVPMIDIHTVGAGGGSVARMDAGGALAVGPESAGADPGPACYGRGEALTVTDANLYLGRLAPDHFLGGAMRLDPERSARAVEALAARAGLSPRETAEGVLRVASATMERALRVISVERGFDPRDFTLLSFGGAGGMHCAELARALGIPRVLVPANPGVLSALGMLLADVVKDYAQTIMRPAEDLDPETLDALFAPLEIQAREELGAEGFAPEAMVLERSVDMRYKGQSFEIMTPVPEDGALAAAFHALHRTRYGYDKPAAPVEAVTLRLRALGRADKPALTPAAALDETMPPDAVLETREAVFDGQALPMPVIDRARLTPGNRLPAPALITEYSATTVVPPWAAARVDAFENIVIATQEDAP